MDYSTSRDVGAFHLAWSLRVDDRTPRDDAPSIVLAYEVHADEELYVSDRLWDFNRERRRVADPFGVYRFVDNGVLRLVFLQAPSPPNLMLRNHYTPLFSRVRPGEPRRGEVRIELPVQEYSALARDVGSPTVVETVSRVALVMGYELRSALDDDPTPPTFEAEAAGFVVYDPSVVISYLDVAPLPVRRRTGYIARYALPGEPGPGPAPYPA